MPVLLLCGSLRRQSLNAQLLQLVPALAPGHLRFVRDTHLAQLPLYNEDLDTDTPPAPVAAFRAALQASRGLVIASPEYNHGIAAPLKNAVDWASRPYANPPISGKSVVVFSATPGHGHGFEGLAQLHALLQSVGNYVVANPRMVLQQAPSKLGRDGAGNLALLDPVAKALMVAQLAALAEALAQDAGTLARRGHQLFAEAKAPRLAGS